MTFLAALGSLIVRGLQIVLGIAPIVQASAPSASGTVGAIASELQQISSIIIQVEAIGQALTPGLTGAQKLQASTPLVAQILLQSAVLSGHTIADPALFTNGAEQIASGMANVLNSLKANVTTVPMSEPLLLPTPPVPAKPS